VKIGFIGLGTMGRPMAANLLKACHASSIAPIETKAFASRIVIKRSFAPGFRIELHQKDLSLALTSARQIGVSLSNTATAQELFNACAAHGGKAWDHSAMVRALELLAGHDIAGNSDGKT
jgi:3-hydroxyisobutyrate dehydrogenase-like beta-hydroxyacid dehydrogenase